MLCELLPLFAEFSSRADPLVCKFIGSLYVSASSFQLVVVFALLFFSGCCHSPGGRVNGISQVCSCVLGVALAIVTN